MSRSPAGFHLHVDEEVNTPVPMALQQGTKDSGNPRASHIKMTIKAGVLPFTSTT